MKQVRLTHAELIAATPEHLDHAKWDDLVPHVAAYGWRYREGDRWHWRETGDGVEITLVD